MEGGALVLRQDAPPFEQLGGSEPDFGLDALGWSGPMLDRARFKMTSERRRDGIVSFGPQ